MKLVYTPEGASPVPQTGHPAPIAHFALPNAVTPHWLVSSDENLTLKAWDIRPEVALDAQGTAPEIAALTLDLGLQDMHTLFWCQYTPRKLWCEDSTGQLGYYLFSDNAQTVDFHLCKPLKPTAHGEPSQALALAQAQTVFFQLSADGGHWLENKAAEPTLSNHSAPTFGDWDLSLVTQTHLCAYENTFFLALRDAQSWQVFSFQALTSQAKPLTPRQPLERKVTDIEKNLMLSPQGDFLVVDRSLYALNEPIKAVGHYYGRALAFSNQHPRLLWASGDSLFITHLSTQNQGQITHHQSLHYNTPLTHWPVYWAVGAGMPALTVSNDGPLPEFWVSDQHRRNASGLLPSAQHDTFERVQQTAGQGGWVESLLFLDEDTLLLGGGARGTLCSLKLTPQAAQLSTRYESTAQPIEQLLLTPQIEQASQEPPQFLTLSGGTLNPHPETSFASPEKPWHKAFFNGALVQISTSATDAVVQLNHKGKTSLQRYTPAQTTWQELTAKLPEKAELLQTLGKRGQLFDSPNAAGPFKIFTDARWRPLESELPFVDQALWQDQYDLLALRCEQEIELWHITETFQYLGTLTSEDLFNAMVFSKATADCWTLDNGGKFQHWRIATQRDDTIEAPQCLSTLQLHNWNEDYQDRVVAISDQGRYIAIGDSDLPLHIWDGQTGERCYACLASLDHEGTEVVINCYSTK